MGRYGRDYGGYRGGGEMGRYDRFRYGPGGPGWGGDRGARWGGGGRGRYAPSETIQAADIMTPNPEAVTPDTPLSEVAGRMRDLDVGLIPVVDDLDRFRLQGVITDRDIAVRAAAEGVDMREAKASEYMTAPVQTVRETDHVSDVFAVMRHARVRRVPVTGEGGELVGIIAQADLAVDYAGLDRRREVEVEEVIERISEPARPRWGDRSPAQGVRYAAARGGREEEDLGERLRDGWDWMRREARQLMGRGYDRDWRR